MPFEISKAKGLSLSSFAAVHSGSFFLHPGSAVLTATQTARPMNWRRLKFRSIAFSF